MIRTTFLCSVCVAIAMAAISASAGDVQTITHGREVDLEDHLVPGKHVIFDFYADWCGPCRALEPHLIELADRHADQLAIRKVDIINWDSAVSRQYRVSSVPYLVLYGPNGNRLAAGDASSVLRTLTGALGEGTNFSAQPSGGTSIVPLLAIATIFAVTIGLVARRRKTAGRTASPTPRPSPVDTTSNPNDPAIWFALLQGSMEGPFTRSQLDELHRRGDLGNNAQVRRRGDANWSTLRDVLD
jgi:thiol-disulfide isomerase/thioredoxin